MNVRQSHVASAEAKRASGVIDPQQVQHGGVQIVNLEPVLDRLVAPLVGCPNTDPPLMPPPAIQIVNAKGL